jgi:hypothetical protein
MRTAIFVFVVFSVIKAADRPEIAAGKAEEKRSCTPCHSLMLVHSQRLSQVAWEKELDKMTRWGARIKERQALLDYLASEYSDKKPVPAPARSQDGRANGK